MHSPFPFLFKETKPANPKLYLCKPDQTTIGRIKYADKISFSLKTGTDLSELNFVVPKYIMRNGKQERYYLFDKMKIKYLIRAVNIWGTEYYVINNPKLDDKNDQWQIHAYLLPYQIQDKKFYSYSTTDADGNESPVTLETALTAALSTTYSWTVGHIDDSLKSLYRSFDIDDTTALDFIQQIADKFKATVSWDTVNRTVNMYDTSTYNGTDKRLYITEKKYLKSLEQDINADTLITRLHCLGSDTISLNSVNPTGQDYIEDYSYFIGDFERDSNGKVIKHSDWMSDDLCIALLNYKKLVEDNTDKFKNYLSQLNSYTDQLITLQTELTSLQTDLNVINDIVTVDTASGVYFYVNKLYTGTGFSYHASLNDFQQYIIMVKSSNPLSCKIDGNNYSINSNWKLCKKISGQDDLNFVLSSEQGSSEVSIIVILITSDEYSTSGNESILIDKYNSYAKQDQIAAKQSEINAINTSISNTQTSIYSLQTLLSPQNNFTQSELQEWDNFVKDDTFSSSDYIDAKELMSDAETELVRVQQPSNTFSISLTNFLQIVECQLDWHKLVLNDVVTIIYDNGVKIKANIAAIDIDFDSGSISLTITNTKNVTTSLEKQWADIYQRTIQSATTLNKKKPTWNTAQYTKRNLDNFLNGNIYANKQSVIAGIDSSETFGQNKMGLISQFGNNITTIYKACILGSVDGGNTWKAIYTPDGVNAEAIVGEFMLDSQTSIKSSDGNVQLSSTGASFGNSAIAIEGGLSKDQIDPELVNQANLGVQAKDQIDSLSNGIGGVNLVSRDQCIGSITDIPSSIGHSNFGITLDYNTPNGFIIPVKYASWTTISFVAYANMDNVDLYISLNTKDQTDMSSDHMVRVNKQSQLFTWTVYYNDEDMFDKDTLLKFWHVNYGCQIQLVDIQLEDGTVRSTYRDATF